MRFKDYITPRLDEKMNKAEYEAALYNPNILIGAEYEFLHKYLINNHVDVSEYDEEFELALDSYHGWVEKFEKWLKKRSQLEKKLETAQSKNQVTKIEDLMSDIEVWEGKFPEVPDDYIHYHNLLAREGIEGYRIWDEEDSALVKDSHKLSEPPEPDEAIGSPLGNEDMWMGIMENKKKTIFSKCPVKLGDIRIVRYHGTAQKPGDTFWKAEFDASISIEGGIEMISPPMPLPEWVNICPKVFNWIKTKGETSETTGFHVHLGLAGVDDLEDVMDPVKLVLLTEEGYIWKFFEGREANEYCSSTKDMLKNDVGKDRDMRMKDVFDHKKMKDKIKKEHFSSINFEGWNKGHVEFRHMGGEEYHLKWDQVRGSVARFAHAVSCACDPEYKKEEYYKKLAKMANELDAFKWSHIINNWNIALSELMSQDERQKVTPSALKEWDRTAKFLKFQIDIMTRDFHSHFGKVPKDNIRGELESRESVMKPIKDAARAHLKKHLQRFLASAKMKKTVEKTIWSALVLST